MATAFNLTARLNIQGPFGVKPVVDKLRSQLNNVKGDVKINFDASVTKRIQEANKALAETERRLKNIQASSAAARNNLSGLSQSFSNVANSTQKSVRSQSQANAVIASTARGAAEAASEMEDFGRVSGLAIRRFAGFTVATSVVFGFVNAVRDATKEAIAFERELIKVQQVTGTSQFLLKGLTDEITRLSTTFGASSSSLVLAARTLSQAGFTAAETQKALEALAKTDLAPTFDNITQTTEGSIAALRQFNIETSELEGVLSSINAVAGKFAVESGDIIAAIRRTGGVFAAAAGDDQEATESLRQFIALFTSVRATTRESAETIATGLRTIFTRIQRRSTIDSLKELGIELETLDGKFVGPFEAIKRLSDGLSSLDPQDLRFAEIVEELGGFRQIGKVIPLIQQFETAQQALKVATEGQGSLAKDAITAQQSLAVQFQKTQESFLALVRDISQTDTFRSIAEGVLQVANTFIDLAGAVKPVLPLLAAFTAFKAAQSAVQFTRGFRSGVAGAGGASGLGSRIGSLGADQSDIASTNSNTAAVTRNTAAQQAQTATEKSTAAVQQTLIGLGKSTEAVLRANTNALGLNSGNLNSNTTALRASINIMQSSISATTANTSAINRLSQVIAGSRFSSGQTAARASAASRPSTRRRNASGGSIKFQTGGQVGVNVGVSSFGGGGSAPRKRFGGGGSTGRRKRFASGGKVSRFGGGGNVQRFNRGSIQKIRQEGRERAGIGNVFASSDTVRLSRSSGKQAGFIKKTDALLDDEGTFGAIFLRPGDISENTIGRVEGSEFAGIAGPSAARAAFPKTINAKSVGNAQVRQALQQYDKQKKGIENRLKQGTDFNLLIRGLDADDSVRIEDRILSGVIDTVEGAAQLLKPELNLNTAPNIDAGFLKKINVDQISGNIFEGLLLKAGNPFSEKEFSNTTFDFPSGLGPGLGAKFDSKLANEATDAKNSFTRDSLRSLIKKVRNQTVDNLRPELNKIDDDLDKEFQPILQSLQKDQRGKKSLSSKDVQESFGVSKAVAGNLRNANFVARAGGGEIVDLAFDEEGLVPALTMPGELIFGPKSTRQAGENALRKFNETGDPSALGSFDLSDVSRVPGRGNSDSFRTDIPEGSFVIRKAFAEDVVGNFNNTKKSSGSGSSRRAANGGLMRFASGGMVKKFQGGGRATVSQLTSPNVGETIEVVIDPTSIDRAGDNLSSSIVDGMTVGSKKAGNIIEAEIAGETAQIRGSNNRAARRPRPNQFGFGRTRGVRGLAGRAGVTAGRSIAGAASKLGPKALSIGSKLGSPGALIATSFAAPLIQGAIGDETAGRAATGAGISGALGGATTGAAIGSAIAPGVGTVVGGVLGGLTGAFASATDAFDQKTSDLARVELAETVQGVADALKGLDTGITTGEDLAKANIEATKAADLASQAQFDTGTSLATLTSDVTKISTAFTGLGFLNKILTGESLISAGGAFGVGQDTTERNLEKAIRNQEGFFLAITRDFLGPNLGADEARAEARSQVLDQFAKDISDSFRESANQSLNFLNRAIGTPDERRNVDDLIRDLGGLENVARQLGATRAEKVRQELGDDFTNATIRDAALKSEGLAILNEQRKTIDVRNKLIDAEIAAAEAARKAGVEINLLNFRLAALGEAASLAASAGEDARSTLASIQAGPQGGAATISTQLPKNLALADESLLNQQLDRISGFIGTDQQGQEAAIIKDLRSTIQDAKFLADKGPQILAAAAGGSGIEGASAEQVVKKLFEKTEFQGLGQQAQNAFITAISELATGKGEKEGQRNLQELLEGADPTEIIDKITNQLSAVGLETFRANIDAINKITNELNKNYANLNKALLKSISAQRKADQFGANIANRVRRFQGLQEDFRAPQRQFESSIVASVGTLDPRQIASTLIAERANVRDLEAQQRAATTPEESKRLAEEIRKSNLEQIKLQQALDDLSNNTLELAAIEKELAQLQKRREAGRDFSSRLRIAASDPQELQRLAEDVLSAQKIIGGGKVSAQEFAGGSSLLRQLGEIQGGDAPKQVGDAIAKSNTDFLRAIGLDAGFAKFLTDAEGKGQERDLTNQFGDALRNQKAALDAQAQAFQDIANNVQTNSERVFNEQKTAFGKIPDIIADKFKDVTVKIPTDKAIPVVIIDAKSPLGEVGPVPPALRSGGFIPGAIQGSNKDSKLINAQPGEFVVRREAVRGNRDFLENLNNGNFRFGGEIPGFRNGGGLSAQAILNRRRRLRGRRRQESQEAPFFDLTKPRPSAEETIAKLPVDLTKPRPSAGELQAAVRSDIFVTDGTDRFRPKVTSGSSDFLRATAQRNLELKRQERAARAKQAVGSEDIDTDALFKESENIQAFQRNKARFSKIGSFFGRIAGGVRGESERITRRDAEAAEAERLKEEKREQSRRDFLIRSGIDPKSKLFRFGPDKEPTDKVKSFRDRLLDSVEAERQERAARSKQIEEITGRSVEKRVQERRREREKAALEFGKKNIPGFDPFFDREAEKRENELRFGPGPRKKSLILPGPAIDKRRRLSADDRRRAQFEIGVRRAKESRNRRTLLDVPSLLSKTDPSKDVRNFLDLAGTGKAGDIIPPGSQRGQTAAFLKGAFGFDGATAVDGLGADAPGFLKVIREAGPAPVQFSPNFDQRLKFKAKGLGRSLRNTINSRPEEILDRLGLGILNRPRFRSGGMLGADNTLIAVQPGEFVVNKSATQQNRGLLESINGNFARKPSTIGGIQRFQNGGLVLGAGAGNTTSGGSVTNIEVNGGKPLLGVEAIRSLDMFSTSSQELTSALNSLNNLAQFSTSLNQAAESLKNIVIPERIQIESAPIQVNVVINGAEALANMEEGIKEMVAGKIQTAINQSVNPITGETNTSFV